MGYTRGIIWTDEDVVNTINKIIEIHQLDHFPTHSEMDNYTGNSSLSAKVSKSGGTRYWANKMNLPIKQCESELGNDYELLAMELIKLNTGYESCQTKPRYPYDLLVNNSIKVDVKVSYPFLASKNGATSNTFNLEKREPTCDIFILFCLNEEGTLIKTVIIPSNVLFGRTQVGIGKKSKWDYFIDKWNYISEYGEFFDKYKVCVPPINGKIIPNK